MAIMQKNSNMVKWKIYLSSNYKAPARDLTSVIGPHTNSIRIRHGMSEGGLTKKNVHSSSYEVVSNHRTREKTAPSELDLQISCHSYLEDLFQEDVCVRIDMENKWFQWVTVFRGIIRNYPYGGAKDMVNFNVRAFSNDLILSYTARNRTFKTKPLTRQSIVTEIVSGMGFDIDYLSKTSQTIVKPNDKVIIQKNQTDMEMLDQLAYGWGCSWNFDDFNQSIIWRDQFEMYKKGDTSSKFSTGVYQLSYRTDRINNNNVESVDWAQSTSQGGSEIEPSVFSYNEKGKYSTEYKINALGKTWKLQDQYLKLSKTNSTVFGELMLLAADLTMRGQGYAALRKFYDTDDGEQDGTEHSVPNGGDNSGVDLTIMLNEGDVDLRAPRTAILYAGGPGGDIRVETNSNLPSWLFKYSPNDPFAMPLNIKETVLTYEQGMLKSELKCTLRTESQLR